MGNRSTGRAVHGVRRTFILLPGYYVAGTLRLPRAHPYAPWLLAWVERLLQGATLAEVEARPPWPVPADPLLGRRLLRALLDLRWLLPDWARGQVAVREDLAARYHARGRQGLAEVLSDYDEHDGEWWMDGLGGTLFSRQTAVQFDYDVGRRPRADIMLEPPKDPQVLLASTPVDLQDLLVKLGGAQLLWEGRDRARLAGPLRLAGRKDIYFPLFGDAVRILPAELAALEPVFARRAPHLFEGGAPNGGSVPAKAPVPAISTASPSRQAAPAAAPRPADGPVAPLIAQVRAGMVPIPAGRFVMGDRRVPKERPCHAVVISRSFFLGQTPVTQGLWEQVMGKLPFLRDNDRHPDFPIIQISYDDILRFLAKLNSLSGGGGFTLPTEAQWEYACRAGSSAAYCFGDDPGRGDEAGPLERYAWTKRSGKRGLQRVGLLLPNAFGLHDMHGLVYEIMRDGPRVYGPAEVTDPIGPMDGEIVSRGGFVGKFPLDHYGDAANEHFRCASRQVYEKGHRNGFRLAWEDPR